MLIQGNCNSGKVKYLAEKYVELISSGVKAEEILVLVLNPYKRIEFYNEVFKLNPLLEKEKHNIFTFWGLCYNAFLDNWDYISNLINAPSDEVKPNLCGLEVSQFIFKQSIKTADFSDYISKVNLLHQLFRRYSLIVQNCLSNNDVVERSEILNESFYREAQKAIDDYKLKTIQYKSFDYLRQLAILPFIYSKTDYFKNIKYFICDDADEFSFAFWSFVDSIMPQLSQYYLAYDENGSSRCGYLCAYKSGIKDFINKYSPKIIKLEDKSKFAELSNEIFENIKDGRKIKNLNLNYNIQLKRLDMFNSVLDYIKTLIKQGVHPSDISIITPVFDEVLMQNFYAVKDGINSQILAGNEKLVQSNTVKYILIILKLLNNLPVLEYEIKFLLLNLLKIPYKKCLDIIKEYSVKKQFKPYEFQEKTYEYQYKKLIALIQAENKGKNTLSSQIKIIYSNLISEFDETFDKDKYDFLVKEAFSFETAFVSNCENITEEFIKQIENSVISENPAEAFYIKKDAVIVSTVQKIIDFSLKTKYQIWLDVSNNEWFKNDTGTLYNSWALNRDWNKKEYTLEDNINLTREKTARMLRKLILCAQEKIVLFSSIYDNTGNENFGGLTDYIEFKEEHKQEFSIIPRDDQKPVLDYKKGKMGIMAVPGAGKTTILLALIIKLINEGINPENIFVLTYMESAAKNFKERIKSALFDNLALPNISTIHGLALRIIKENGNYAKVGLDENFEICDDNTKEKIAKELFYKLKLDDENYENYLRCISIVKLSGNKEKLHSKFKEIQTFYNFYNEYNIALKQLNYIDYDDMLCFSVKILEKDKEVLKYYQNICQYIIEDEAQDSTDIQQKLIALLSGKYQNVVRCGDINQAITSTFTNSDLESFRSFINNNNKVEMVSSQRCAKPIYMLANRLIKEADSDNAFYNIEMKETANNPRSNKQPQYLSFNAENEEKAFILSKTKEIIKDNQKASIAVLLRLNSQVNEYNELFLSNNIKTSLRSDCLSQKSIYRLIISLLKVLQNPLNNKLVFELAKIYQQNNIVFFAQETLDYIKNLNSQFIKMNVDEISNEQLLQLYWDIDYWLNNSSMAVDILALNIGLYYSKNSADKSNSYIISTLIKRLTENSDTMETIIKKLEYAAQKSTSAYKFFEEEIADLNETPINIMTMHKSKGDEFDYVFIPELNEENYSVTLNNVKLKSGSHFVQTIKNSVDKSGIKSPEQLKKEQINETLRLLYVGVTRAKKELYLSNAINYKKRRNTKKLSIFETILLETN